MNNNDKIIDIQLLRGLSIILVLIDHSWFIQSVRHDVCLFPGWIGVELFFIISGFVVVRSFERGSFAVWQFATRRFFRLYPSIAVVLAAVLLLNLAQPANGPPWFKAPEDALLGQSLAILSGTFPSTSGISYTTGPYWTLIVELRFYSALALAVLLCGLISKDNKYIKICVAALAGAAYVYLSGLRILSFFGIKDIASYFLFYKYDFLALGVLAGLCSDRILGKVAHAIRYLWPFFLLLPLVAISVSRSPGTPAAAVGDMLDSFTLVLVGWSFLLLVVAASQGMIVRRCSARVAAVTQWIGDRSFLLYILHMACYVLCWYALHSIRRQFTDQPIVWILQPIVTCAIMLPIVAVLHRWVEVPGIRLGSMLCRAMSKGTTKRQGTPDSLGRPDLARPDLARAELGLALDPALATAET